MVLYHIPTEVQKDTKEDPFYKPVVWWIGVQNPTEVFCESLMSFRSEQVVLLYWVGSPLMTIPGSEKRKKYNYSWLPITWTLTKFNLALTQTKVAFPWISFLHLL